MRKMPLVNKVCPNCGCSFTVTQSLSHRVFCNRHCSYKYMKKQLQYKKLLCSFCGKGFWKREDRLKSIIKKGYKNTYCSATCQAKAISGKNNVSWSGGYQKLSERIRRSSRYKSWRQKVLDYYSYTCVKCGTTAPEAHVHHKNYTLKNLIDMAKAEIPNKSEYVACLETKPLWDINNGEVVCRGCHMEMHQKV